MLSYCYNDGKFSSEEISAALEKVLGGAIPVICCIGTDAVIGDSLGPVAGTTLDRLLHGKTYVYGSLKRPIIASDVESLSVFLKKVHPDSPILAIDAAIGAKEEVGNVKITDTPLKPGLGVKKDLSSVGTASIIGIIADKTRENPFSDVRLSRVFTLSDRICDGIVAYFDKIEAKRTNFVDSSEFLSHIPKNLKTAL